jgi:CRP/FNR family transcriptional regulator
MGSTSCAHVRDPRECEDCSARSLSVCSALDVGELDGLHEIARSTFYPNRSSLFRQGEPSEFVFNVTEGVVRLARLLPDGRRQIVGFAMPGDFLGVSVHATYGFSADAVEDVAACKFGRKAYEDLVASKPHLLKRLHDFSANELSLAQDQITLLGRCTAEERIASFLLHMRRRWAVVRGKPSVTVHLPMSRQDIADFLGLTIETVSRTISRMARDKELTVVPNGVRLSDVRRFEQLAAS